MAVQVFSSSDYGAPAITGSTSSGHNTTNDKGSLANAIEKILVDGYGSKSGTITRSGSTATLSCTAHAYGSTGDFVYITVDGADQTEYNLTKVKATIVDANTMTYTVSGTPASPATGSITFKRAAVGWTKTTCPGSFKVAFKQPAGSQQRYIVVDENTTAEVAEVYGCESLDGSNNPVDTFPYAKTTNSVNYPASLYVCKGQSGASSAKTWYCVTNGKTIYFLLDYVSSSFYGSGFIFGDYNSLDSSGSYDTILMAGCETSVSSPTRTTPTGSNVNGNTRLTSHDGNNFYGAAGQAGNLWTVLCRNATADFKAAHAVVLVSYNLQGASTSAMSSTWGTTYPNKCGDTLLTCEAFIMEPNPNVGGSTGARNYTLRGSLAGSIMMFHKGTDIGGHNTIVTGNGVHAGKKWILKKSYNASTEAYLALEISDTW